jgi:small subunit ribosomal protein S13
MPRLLGVDIPGNKKLEYSLQYIYGIGPAIAKEIVSQTGIDPNIRARDLNDQQLTELSKIMQDGEYALEGDLRREISMNLKRLKAIKSYRGMRHSRGLPVRGQRTSTNARTRKGPKKTVGVTRKS